MIRAIRRAGGFTAFFIQCERREALALTVSLVAYSMPATVVGTRMVRNVTLRPVVGKVAGTLPGEWIADTVDRAGAIRRAVRKRAIKAVISGVA